MNVSDLTRFLETLAPLALQEDYDNAGLITGKPGMDVRSAIISLDATEAVLDEAIETGANLIISHHPIVFKGLKKLNGQRYVERVVEKAIKNDIALYAIHTNYDNVIDGVNARICARLGITNTRILAPKTGLLRKLVTFAPEAHAETVKEALFSAGAGAIGDYDECSFNVSGTGTFRPGENTNPYSGTVGERKNEAEIRIETIFPAHLQKQIIVALIMAHPYEEVAYDIFPTENSWQQAGAGMIGEIAEAVSEADFLARIKEKMEVKVIRHTRLRNTPVRKVAVCGGSGSFLLGNALAAGADFFITADFKYHEFFDAEKKLVIADIGHFESEQFTQHLLLEKIREKFPNFAVRLTAHNTNPVNYYF
ncbi:MAG: Nif3-like dinuclear metal center hexameric protein [Mucilaginibacter polytrichastri]|nr:Nif3-like dinuclear metal center hexameric protein [Mucilaginibacter polytrichastri]